MQNTVRNNLESALGFSGHIHTLVTAVELPSGAKEVAINTDKLEAKIGYILNAYDTEMRLRTNPEIVMVDAMIVYGDR